MGTARSRTRLGIPYRRDARRAGGHGVPAARMLGPEPSPWPASVRDGTPSRRRLPLCKPT